jgi:RimJ/RimL family protein N-acetyltransferase
MSAIGSVDTASSSFPLRTQLRDGTRVRVRPLRSGDGGELLKGFQRLSISSRRFRFLSPIRKLTDWQLKALIEVDQVNHVAIGVQDISRPGRPGIGIGRFVRLEKEPWAAEFAITVIDDYQRRGVGTLLLRLLIKAAQERGIETLQGFLLEDNTAMIGLLVKFGACLRRDAGNILCAELPVAAVAAVRQDSFRSPS